MASAYAVQALGMYLVSRRYLVVPYEWRRVLTLALWTGAIFGLDRFFAPPSMTLAGLAVEAGLFLAYGVGLFALGVVRREEIRDLVSTVRSSRRSAEGA